METPEESRARYRPQDVRLTTRAVLEQIDDRWVAEFEFCFLTRIHEAHAGRVREMIRDDAAGIDVETIVDDPFRARCRLISREQLPSPIYVSFLAHFLPICVHQELGALGTVNGVPYEWFASSGYPYPMGELNPTIVPYIAERDGFRASWIPPVSWPEAVKVEDGWSSDWHVVFRRGPHGNWRDRLDDAAKDFDALSVIVRGEPQNHSLDLGIVSPDPFDGVPPPWVRLFFNRIDSRVGDLGAIEGQPAAWWLGLRPWGPTKISRSP